MKKPFLALLAAATWSLSTAIAAPTLGTYSNISVPLSGDATVTPSAAPTNTVRVTVTISTSFKGRLEGNPVNGVVRVTDANPAGSYTVTVTAFDSAGVTTTKTFLLTVTTTATCVPVSFAAAADSTVGSNPVSVAVGDFNRDGNQDLAVVNQGTNNVSILLGDGAGGFGAPTNHDVGSNPMSVAVGDFNGDGKQDIAVANLSSANVSILLGDGAGGFGTATNFSVGFGPSAVAVADFNGDHKQDLAFSVGTNLMAVLLGDGTGSFGAPTAFGVNNDAEAIAVGDFNGDGKQDIAVANGAFGNNPPNNVVSIFLGDGADSFTGPTNFAVGNNPRSIAIGDFNGDGVQDLAVADNGAGKVSILLGNGTGGFSAATDFNAGGNAVSVALGDFNGDGKQDLVTVNFNSPDASILLGDGLGGFGAPTKFSVGANPFSVAVGDFNGDGKQDVVAANLTSDTVSLLLRDCSLTAPTIQFSAATYSVGEGAGQLTVTVTRTGDTAATSTVHYATSNGTATAGSDYTNTSGDLTFGPTVTSRTFDVPVIDDSLVEGNETFTVKLTAPTGATLGSPSIATVTIVDNDQTPTPTPTPSATPSPTPAAVQLSNISGRTFVEFDAKSGICGFIITGGTGKKVIVRGIGPSLEGATPPVSDALQNPMIELHDGTGSLIFTNLDWRDTQETAIENSQLAPSDDREAAVIATLQPGAYTAIVRGEGGTTGVGLVEVYELDSGQGQLANVSVRGDVLTGEDVLITGVILTGGTSEKVVFRALGPELTERNLTGVLADPTLDIYDADGTLLSSNDNWMDGADASEISADGLAPTDDRESALLLTLPAGTYTAIVRGVNGETGLALAEAYRLPEATPSSP